MKNPTSSFPSPSSPTSPSSSPFSIICPICGRVQTAIADPESGEIICSSCGMVIYDNIQDYTRQEWCAFTPEEVKSKARTGATTSLSRYDRGLSTIIGRADRDASGQKIDSAMQSTFERLRTWDSRIKLHGSSA